MENIIVLPGEDEEIQFEGEIPGMPPGHYYPFPGINAPTYKATVQKSHDEFDRMITAMPVGSSVVVCTACRHWSGDMEKCTLDQHIAESSLSRAVEQHGNIVVMSPSMAGKKRIVTKVSFPVTEYMVSDLDTLGSLSSIIMPQDGIDGMFNNNYGRSVRDNVAVLGDGKYATIRYSRVDNFIPMDEKWGNDVTEHVKITYRKSLAEVCSCVLATRLMVKYQLELGEYIRKSLSLINAHMFYEPDAGEGAAQTAADWKNRLEEQK